ncbi:16S rRNA pseudouridine(516) synthase RsuA [Nitrincola sp. MINF-07-Sa-05]|uniref:16S rRNA pseudouridine(516) synthase RsuA n=1 Tax=Nitrincola salilacus TaxID=3400273 RepID=UPI00391812DE
MRLDKYLSQATDYSRKEVKRLIHAYTVTVNGEVERDSGRHITPEDEVVMDGINLSAPSTRYLMLYKPEGVVCSTDDPTHPTVIGLIDLPKPELLHIAGRLDVDATGLVLLTDDGKWSHRITSPRHKSPKRYLVTTAEPIEESAIAKFEQGLWLKGEKMRTKPAGLKIFDPHSAEVTLHEGRYHQVKRMFASLGNRVITLHRASIGSIVLDEALEPGEFRHLTEEEVLSFESS